VTHIPYKIKWLYCSLSRHVNIRLLNGRKMYFCKDSSLIWEKKDFQDNENLRHKYRPILTYDIHWKLLFVMLSVIQHDISLLLCFIFFRCQRPWNVASLFLNNIISVAKMRFWRRIVSVLSGSGRVKKQEIAKL
jgi:hypothetical protein